ncbi:PH-domain-containing protein [Pluteus cervinus]|uniref:PH-domain-containing protein n=1 Tax=Pluteus cervinus TaxID=181527 RepID=A0ACD3AY70_9AGAR|nr:PH-domain-containing protein [Pluteus cervinus]
MSTSVAPPTPQEIQRKLSVANRVKPTGVSVHPVSGAESDSDSIDVASPSNYVSGLHTATSASHPPLSAIAERGSGSGEDSEEEEEEEGGWKSAGIRAIPRGSEGTVIKSGYLWKKGERRKTWKKRWFVLRSAHLAYYKSSAEYQLLRLLELSDVHSCTPVALKRHQNAFGLVSPIRTFYLQAKTAGEVQDWVAAIEEARQALRSNPVDATGTNPIPIPKRSNSHPPPPITPSPPSHISAAHNLTSSESDDASPGISQIYENSFGTPVLSSPSKNPPTAPIDPSKAILSGYLMKCGHKRRTWRKRWFVLTGEKLVYSGSHMDTKPHRQFMFSDILDALEYDMPSHRQASGSTVSTSPSVAPEAEDANTVHTFKIVTTKRSLLLCAPSEEDEIRWLGAVRALIARRSGIATGIAPKVASSPPNDATPIAATTPAVTASGSGGLKNKARRSSASGSGGITGIPE